jgi:hypothetical protein
VLTEFGEVDGAEAWPDALERARTPLSLDGLGAILHGEPGEGK